MPFSLRVRSFHATSPSYLFAFFCAFASSIFLMISSSSSAMLLSIFAPRLGSFPCICAGRVGSTSPALVSALFTLPDVSVESPFASSAAARRLPIERSSSVELTVSRVGERKGEGGTTHWSRWLGGSYLFLPRTGSAARLLSLLRICFAGHRLRRHLSCRRWIGRT